ncbi:MAG: PAS domain S-box protein [Candidatus Hermodarchaeota archaeon]
MKNRKLLESEYITFCDNFPYPIFLLDSDKKISNCNSISEMYLKRAKETLIGTKFLKLFPLNDDLREKIDDIISNAVNFRLSEMINFKFMNSNNQETWVELIFSPIDLREKMIIQIILQDITEQKLVERIITEENEKLRELDKLKQQLMAQISDNLKSPLNNIYKITDLLLNSYENQLDPNIIRLLSLIKKGGEKSIDMVGKILDISQIESDNLDLNLQTENLIDVIRSSIDEINDENVTKYINLKFNNTDEIYSEIDKIRIKQAFKYFLVSLIKNSSPHRNVIIKIQQNNNYADIIITLTNCNINELKSSLNLGFLEQIINLHQCQFKINSEIENELKFNIKFPIKDWRDSLIHLYIIYKSGIPLYNYSFFNNKDDVDASLISGGIIGMITILKAIIQGSTPIKTIDHGDRKLMFETNKTDDIIFVLMVKEDLKIIKNKLISFINGFDNNYYDLIKNIENTSYNHDNWIKVLDLIKNYFR